MNSRLKTEEKLVFELSHSRLVVKNEKQKVEERNRNDLSKKKRERNRNDLGLWVSSRVDETWVFRIFA